MPARSGWDLAARHLDAAVAGDRVALNSLIRAVQAEIWRYLAYHAGTRDADDLTQETFIRMMRALPRFERRSSLQTWTLVIAHRVVVDHFRDRSRRPVTVDAADWSDTIVPSIPDGSGTVEINSLLASLNEERREALVLTQLIGLSYADAAEVVGCPIGTVRSRVARAREDLVRLTATTDERGVG